MGALVRRGWIAGLRAWLSRLFSLAQAPAEAGAVDLREQVTAAIVALAQYDHRGYQVLPGSITLQVRAPVAHHPLLRRHVQDPSFDEEVKASLLNALFKLSRAELPAWTVCFVADDEFGVHARADVDRPVAWLEVRGGDRDGTVVAVPSKLRVFCLGRSEQHGADDGAYNDLIVSASDRYVSRRGAALHRDGGRLLLEPRDQGEDLVVVRQTGERVIPARLVSQRAQVAIGDQILFMDGKVSGVVIYIHDMDPRLATTDAAGG